MNDVSYNSRVEQVQAYFDQADRYLRFEYRLSLRRRIIRELLGTMEGVSILDLGCGNGSNSLQYLSADNDITLVDLSERMLEAAERNTAEAFRDHVRYVQANLHEFEADKQYDVVMCIGLLAHVPSPDDALERIFGLVRPGGKSIVQLTDHATLLGKLAVLSSRLVRLLDRERYRLNKTTVQHTDAKASQMAMRLLDARRLLSPLPGMGRLPDRWVYNYQLYPMQHRRLSKLGSEVFLLHERAV